MTKSPEFIFADSNSIPWQQSEMADGVQVKTLCSANGQTMEIYKFAPNCTYPDHFHEGVEFVYLLEGEARQNGKWLSAGWSSVAEKGTIDSEFISGDSGCTFLTVYAASRYL